MALWAIQVRGWALPPPALPLPSPSPSKAPFTPQVTVAIISFLETMLLIYLSYKVSAHPPGPL